MNLIEWCLIGLALSMDAAAVSVCKGLAAGKVRPRHCLLAGGYFGVFQALMPALGYCLGRTFASLIDRYAHWVAFLLLAIIGANMLRESFSKEEEECHGCSFAPAAMLPLAVATSIDALAVGVSFSFYMDWTQLAVAVAVIGCITLVISAVSVWLGSLFGAKNSHIAERAGGIILLLIGVKILLEGLGFWPF